jgi:hypothetical protein
MDTHVTVCTFRRTKTADEEWGILIGNGDLIVDKNNKPVKSPIWDYHVRYEKGYLPIKIDEISLFKD